MGASFQDALGNEGDVFQDSRDPPDDEKDGDVGFNLTLTNIDGTWEN